MALRETTTHHRSPDQRPSESPPSFLRLPQRKEKKNENVVAAKEAGLRYVSDQQPGFSRRRAGKGFYYLDHESNKISHDETLARIRSLVLPPAWRNVWICRFPNGHLQATGRDDRERKQYKYHMRWSEVRNETKFEKLALFGDCLPDIRTTLDQHLRLGDLSRENVLATVVKVMEETMIRIGNCEYAEENASFGLTTLRDEHAKIKGSEVHFKFKGKSGIDRSVTLRDRRLSRLIQGCQDLPGQELFAYEDSDGSVHDIESGDVNEYLRDVSGEMITAKDYRTWGATVRAAMTLHELGPRQGATQKEHKTRERLAIEAAAELLGNTIAVCRKYYVHPIIIEADADGRLEKAFQRADRKLRGSETPLSIAEAAVMSLLSR